MPAELVALEEGLRILLDKPILLLGRDAECDIQFDSRKVSRRHCCIAQVGDQLVVRDLGSTNGIRINGVRVIEGYLKDGDELAIGSHRYQVCWCEKAHHPPRSEVKKPVVKERPHTLPVQAFNDDDLEECDEPVPLDEPGAVPDAKVLKPGQTGVQKGGDPPSGRSIGPPRPPIVPEHLELAPTSDSFTSQGPPPPPAP